MKIHRLILIMVPFALLSACKNSSTKSTSISKIDSGLVYAKEPNDSSSYIFLKYEFYLSKTGQLCERKLAMARDSLCNCEFVVYYDSTFSIFTQDTSVIKPLNKIVDINSFVSLDSCEYSKDKNKVFYFHGNSDGGIRVIVDKADPITFKRLCEYRWGVDKKFVFYNGSKVEGLSLKGLQVLFPPDTAEHFIQYVKDDKNVFFEDQIVKGADTKTFKVVSGQNWEAEDKTFRYKTGRRQE